MNDYLVSILIPVFNREKIVRKTLESACEQTYKRIEIVIVDNCSDDKTYEICREYQEIDERIRLFRNSENIGPVKNWIECLNHAKGKYVKFLWSDDWMDNDYIENTLPFIRDNNDTGFVFSSVWIVNEIKNKKSLAYCLSNENRIIDSSVFIKKSILNGGVPVSPGCALFRKNDLNKAILLNVPNSDKLSFDKYGAGNDLLIFLLIANKYKKIAYINNSRCYFRAHKGSITMAESLDLYYDWAKLFFLNNYDDFKLCNKFKTVLFDKLIFNNKYFNIYRVAQGKIDFIYLCVLKQFKIEKIQKKIVNKLKEII